MEIITSWKYFRLYIHVAMKEYIEIFYAGFEEKYILLHLLTLANLNNYHIIMIDIIINSFIHSFIATLFFSCRYLYPSEWFFIA